MMVKTTIAVILAVAITGHAAVLSAADDDNVRLLVGRSAVVNTDWPIARVSLTSSDVADALVTMPNQLLIQGKVPGTISMFVWDRGGAMRRYNVTVERDVTQLTQQVKDLFPGEPISVESNGKSVVLAGMVSSKYVAEKAVEVASGFVEKKEDVVSLLQVREGPPPQVMLRVRFAEVSRSALTELGASFFTGPGGYKNFVGRSSTQQFPAPDFVAENGETKLVFSDFLNLFVFDLKNNLGGVIRALQTKGLFQSLAEPNLVAETGKEASFLAGGEFPIPVAQAGTTGLAITVVFKEFGIRLNFTPNVVGTDRVRLKVRPEVSTLDFTNAIVLQGFRIPALSTRRTETELELRNGQTFAIAGLMNNTATQSLQKIPGIGDIPILGLLFKSKAAQKQQTELVVMITPEILPQNSVGVTSELPRLQEPYLAKPDPKRTFPSPPAAFPRTGGNDAAAASPAPALPQTASQPTAPAKPSPTEAAAVMRGQMPKAPAMITEVELAGSPAATRVESATPPVTATTAAVPQPKPAGKDDQKKLDKQREQERKAQARQAGEAYRAQQEAAQQEQKRQQQLAREKAKKDAEAADKASKESARQAEVDKKRQKEIDEAAKRLKDAEAAYQAQLNKKTKS
jgi:pilus assembly protein CpaC